MNLLEALVLGMVQGASEFLPISSSAHLILVPWWLGWDTPSILFSVVVHLGTLVAVVIYFRRELGIFFSIFSILRNRRITNSDEYILIMLIVGTVPAAIIGLLAEEFFAEFLFDPLFTAITLFLNAFILIASERGASNLKRIPQFSYMDALLIGSAQAFAILPGISRSGSTIATALWRDVHRADAAHYSFLLSIPIIAGAGAKEFLDILTGEVALNGEVGAALLVGFLSSAIVGYICIAFLLSFIKRRSLSVFATYCAVIGGVSLIAILFRG